MKNVSLKDLIDKNKLLTEKSRKTPEEVEEEVAEARRRFVIKWTEKVKDSDERKPEETADDDAVPSESA